MAVLVTGGAGYIGSVTVEGLRSRGFAVIVADDLTRGHRQAVDPAIPLLVGSVTDPAFVDQVFASYPIEAVLHFAASSLVGESMRDPGAYFRNNIGGVLSVASAMARHRVRYFILSSTAAAYGEPLEIPITETAPTRPTNPYGESKLACERILHWFGAVHDFSWTALRYFNAAGASAEHGEDHKEETHLIPIALQAAAGRRAPLPVFGVDYDTPDGTCVRDYIHVEDLADAHLLALERLKKAEGGIYNLGNGLGFSVLQVIESVERVTGRKVPRALAPRRAGDPPVLVASSQKARAELGWNPRRGNLDVIVESAWRWMEAHPHGYSGPPATEG
jgi:UDP-glucose 4-epimerase